MCGKSPSRIARPSASPRPSPSRGPARMTSFIRPVSCPQAELAGRDVAGDALGGGADQGEFPIVDRPGPVHGDVVDQAAFHQVDEVRLHAGPQDVGAHHQDAGAARSRFASANRSARSGNAGWSNAGGSASSGRYGRASDHACRSASGWMRSRERSNCG